MRSCEDCKTCVTPGGYDPPLCYGCLYRRYIAHKAENEKNFKLLCETEQRLALALMKLTRGGTT